MKPQQQPPRYSVVIPVYNSQNTIRSVCEALEALFRERQARYEIVLVDDGSKDQSWPELKTIRAANEQVKIIRLAKNFGQQNALLCGFAHTRGDFVITMDDDLQHPPQELPKFHRNLADLSFAEKILRGLGEEIDRQLQDWDLTPVERETALMLLKGFGHKEIAELQQKSERTVRQHAVAIYRKSGLSGGP